MRRYGRFWALGFAALLAVSTSVEVLTLAGPAGATSGTTCRTFSGNIDRATAALTGCTRSTTGGAGTMEHLHSTQGLYTVKWKNGGTTNIQSTSGGTKNRCPSGFINLDTVGRVTKSTGAAAAIKGAVHGYLCASEVGGKVTLLSGTVYSF